MLFTPDFLPHRALTILQLVSPLFSKFPPPFTNGPMEEQDHAAPAPALPCGNPNCPDPSSTARLQFIPRVFTGPRVLGATSFHRKKADCARHFGLQNARQAPGRKRKEETLTIPVGKRLETDKCPPFLRAIHDLWGHRYIPLAPYVHTASHWVLHVAAVAGEPTFPRCARRTEASLSPAPSSRGRCKG